MWFWLCLLSSAGWRLWIGLSLILSGSIGGASYGVAALLSVGLGCVNAKECRFRATGWQAVVVPLLYAAGFFVQPTGPGQPALWAVPFAWILIGLLLYLGRNFTFAVPTYRRIVTGGPYAIVRHPLIVFTLLTRLALTCSYGGLWNWGAFAICCAKCVAEVAAEESFLRTVPEWRAYAKRVRWRVLPGVC